MEKANWVAVLAAGVSIFSAVAAWQSSRQAAALKEREFATEKTLEILSSVYSEVLEAQQDQVRAKWSCFFVETLARTEERAVTGGPNPEQAPRFVRGFVDDVTRAGLWNSSCAPRLEALVSGADPQETYAAAYGPPPEAMVIVPREDADAGGTPPAAVPQPDPRPAPGVSPGTERVAIGRWHALIASYDVTEKGCRQATDDVDWAAKALAAPAFRGAYDGRTVSVVRTTISNNYVATVDAGDDRGVADALVTAIRTAAADRRDGTGRDSYAQGNRNWQIDPGCDHRATVGG
ncbi:hypothetical protein FDP22_09705 [Paroceanicella profunda]|uniref:Uncharacterized protein n=1 Tax=Paroceanicella profunda TaxID=2579971 RepID=A0A5B8FTD6_9RHOB|nr:hypothetical protein [Paroceanicella profunda]QDL92026.1 hypothetical protein FDP22_09705 [Paroceanicella profunda]